MAKNQHNTKDFFFKFLRGMSVRQKLGVILESKVVQKLSLEKKDFTKKRSPKLIFLDKKNSFKNINLGDHFLVKTFFF